MHGHSEKIPLVVLITFATNNFCYKLVWPNLFCWSYLSPIGGEEFFFNCARHHFGMTFVRISQATSLSVLLRPLLTHYACIGILMKSCHKVWGCGDSILPLFLSQPPLGGSMPNLFLVFDYATIDLL